MLTPSRIIAFILVNALGFGAVLICYVIGMRTGVIGGENSAFDAEGIRIFFTYIIATWLICAAFSIASFFFNGWARAFFLAAPAIIPLAYGLRLMFF